MIRLAVRKLLANPWLAGCLLLGSLFAVALIASIPMFTESILQRLLVKDLESSQVATREFPGVFAVERYFYGYDSPAQKVKDLRSLDHEIGARIVPSFGLPSLTSTRELDLASLQLRRPGTVAPNTASADPRTLLFASFKAMEGASAHMRLVSGRTAAPGRTDGVIEVTISEKAARESSFALNDIYDVLDVSSPPRTIAQVQIVGVFAAKDPADMFWYRAFSTDAPALMIDPGAMESSLDAWAAPYLETAIWYSVLDYHAIRVAGVKALNARIADFERFAHDNWLLWAVPMKPVLESYAGRADGLGLMLWFLEIPVLLMLVFFIAMISQLIIEHDANEIAVLKSRGARSRQIFLVYLTQSGLLAGCAVACGLPLGLFVVRALGSCSGFLEFVNRRSLPAEVTLRALGFALIGAALFMVSMLVPAFTASRLTIVERKKRLGHRRFAPFWKRFYLDLVLLGLSLYGLFDYAKMETILRIAAVGGSRLPLDPLLFVVSVAFMLGAGLLFLRLYPLLVRGVFRVGRAVWSPILYATFVRIGRSFGHEQFLMIFLVLSLGLGVYNSVTARTVNRNVDDQIRYGLGADVTLAPRWVNLAGTATSGGVPDGGTSAPSARWVEPAYFPYQSIAGTSAATKVLAKEKVSARFGSKARDVSLMGIVPNEFARVAWFRTDLLPLHWYAYLNALTRSPKAMLLSTNLREAYGLRLGDVVTVSWAGQSDIDGYVAGFVEYWPTYNERTVKGGIAASLVVANLSYLQARAAIEPYQVWLRKSPGATSRQVYDSIREKDLAIVTLKDADQEIIARRNDPALEGTNGMLTLGFIITMGISLLGFMIYWILSLRSRSLQFGVMRAMGLTRGQLVRMLVYEQILLSGAAMVMGVVIGRLASSLFVPILQLSASAADQVPPFRIVFASSDLVRILVAAGVLLVAGAGLFRWMIGRIRMAQAVKLGEE